MLCFFFSGLTDLSSLSSSSVSSPGTEAVIVSSPELGISEAFI